MNQSDFVTLAVQVIPSVVANGLTSLLGQAGKRLWPSRAPRIAEDIRNNEAVSSLLQKASAMIARELPDVEHKFDLLKQFLVSPELDAIVRQIYSTKLVPSGSADHLTSIRKEFLLSLRLHLDLVKTETEGWAETLFDALQQSCDRALNHAIQEGNLEAVDAKASFRHNIILDQLGAIKRNLELLKSKDQTAVRDILSFEEKFRSQVGERHACITPPNLATAKKIPLEDLYVANNFTTVSPRTIEPGTWAKNYGSDDFIQSIARTVVLGNPGGGKSTFTQMVCHLLATKYDRRLVGNRLLTPFLVVLRDYGSDKKTRHCSILDFIELTCNSKYQIKAPVGALEYLFLNGRALVIFDGLDELLDTSYRREISADVENFASLYPSVPILVTSREVGYDQAPLDRKKFGVYYINEFNDAQVHDYAKKWFATDEDSTPDQNAEIAQAFLRESETVKDLRGNPLILGLMCNIYRGESYIPKNRPSVYEKCALMLFDRWDRSRRIDVQFSFEDKLSPVMKHLAFWIYSDPKLQTGVTESKLIDKAAEYLHQRLFEDADLARKTARDFIEFCRGRAWVFTDTGSTAEGELLYQFTHRTFLEYFTAAQLVRTHARPSDLAPVLIPRIEKREWDIVAQLAFQLQNNNIEGAADELLLAVLAKAKHSQESAQFALYSFAARSLEFLLPNRKTVREIATDVFSTCIKVAVQRLPRNESHYSHSETTHRVQSLVRDLFNVAFENRMTVADTVKPMLTATLCSTRRNAAESAYDFARFCSAATVTHGYRQSEATTFWSVFGQSALAENNLRLRELAQSSPFVARSEYIHGTLSLRDLFAWHGIGEFYVPTLSVIFSRSYIPIVDFIFRGYPQGNQPKLIKEIEEFGDSLDGKRPPWVHTRVLGHFGKTRFKNWAWTLPTQINPGLLFGLFALVAVLLESGENRLTLTDTLRFFRSSRNSILVFVRDLVLLRYTADVDTAQVLGSRPLTEKQKVLISQWAAREISFVEGARRSRKQRT